MNVKRRRINAMLLGAAWIPIVGAAPPTPQSIKDSYGHLVRVQSIFRRIMAANVAICPTKRADHGFTALLPNPNSSATVRAAWTEALGLGEGPTVVSIMSRSPAEFAGLRVGDRIAAVEGIRWSPATQDRGVFGKAWASALTSDTIHLKVLRGSDEIGIAIKPQQICSADVVLTSSKKINASANGSTIVIDGGLERLLPSDDELAFVIAHEAAHVFMGHSGIGRANDLKNTKIRFQMEKDADSVGLRLMLRAGYPPEASVAAHPKIANASRGPISRLLDLTGPYMGTKDRVGFLKSEAAKARAELSKPSLQAR